jgi:hypothetical protein
VGPAADDGLAGGPILLPAAEGAAGALPDGDRFAEAGRHQYRVVGGTSPIYGTSGRVIRYTAEIEDGVTPAEGEDGFAAFVEQTLADQRSWTSAQDVSLQRVGEGAVPDFRVTLTSRLTVRDLCGFDVEIESSCYQGDQGRVVINDARWVRGATSYAGDLTAYRRYAINHEVGHALGHGHQPCQNDGDLAPVMMQQTWSTANDVLNAINGSVAADGKVCRANPWPNPDGAAAPAPSVPARG